MRKIKNSRKNMRICLSILSLSILISGCTRAAEELQKSETTSYAQKQEKNSIEASILSNSSAAAEPVYYTTDLNQLHAQNVNEPSYVTKRMTVDNYFEIDQDLVL